MTLQQNSLKHKSKPIINISCDLRPSYLYTSRQKIAPAMGAIFYVMRLHTYSKISTDS